MFLSTPLLRPALCPPQGAQVKPFPAAMALACARPAGYDSCVAERKTIVSNRRARFEYDILERLEAGMALVGSEVKSLRDGRASLAEAYAVIDNGEAFVCQMHIPPYEPASRDNHDPTRRRKLLLHKRELKHLVGKVAERGLALVPLSVYFNARGIAKLEVALARGRKLYDKREAIKRRDARRDAERALARSRRG